MQGGSDSDQASSAGIPADLQPGEAVLVSACLAGEEVNYKGGAWPAEALMAALEAAGVRIVTVCPEMMGGLGTPRPPAEMNQGDGQSVLDGAAQVLVVGPRTDGAPGPAIGTDVSAAFVSGANQAVAIAREHGARYAFLAERSPSCGVHRAHSGGGVVDGPGVTTAALRAAGVEVFPGDA